jgi:tetratricopeptide (TPR) repeat protein
MTLTYLDSIVADLRIRNLKGGWPFLKGKINNMALQNFQPANPIQSLALGMVLKKLNWEEAHLQAALWYRDNDQADAFFHEMRAILENIPLNPQPFKLLIDGLIQYQRIDDAYPYLLELDERLPDAYSKKWLGIYYLYKQSYQKALAYLLQSAQMNDQDPQLLYNLAGAHLHNQQYQEALQAIEKCLEHDKDFPGAQRMKQDLIRLMQKNSS